MEMLDRKKVPTLWFCWGCGFRYRRTNICIHKLSELWRPISPNTTLILANYYAPQLTVLMRGEILGITEADDNCA